MQTDTLVNQFKQAILKPEPLWEEEISKGRSWQELLKSPALPLIGVVAVLSALLTMLFGYHIPLIGVVRPTIGDMLMQMIGTVIMFMISLLLFGWLAAWLADLLGGKNDLDRSVAMFFWISIPSLFGQVLSTIPMVGWVIGIGLGIYSLILLYRAIPIFLEVPIENHVKHFIFFIIASILLSMLLGSTIGKLFSPTGIQEKISEKIPMAKQISEEAKKQNKSPDAYLESYIGSMMKGDYGQEVIEESAKDTFTPPKDNRLTAEQVDAFIVLAKKAKIVQKEQAAALKQKYDKREKEEEPSITDIFGTVKDFSGIATLEMKVVKSNGGNWAEYQWVKDRIREAYFTPSLSDVTQYNAKLIKEDRDLIAEIL